MIELSYIDLYPTRGCETGFKIWKMAKYGTNRTGLAIHKELPNK